MHLEKGIPLAAGLGGGSSDAATTLFALSSLWGLHMTADNLQNLAAALGSDVPFFLVGGTVLASERGQKLQPLPDLPEHWVVIARPALDIPDKTRLMYSHLTPREYTTGTVTRHMARLLQDDRRLEPGQIYNAFEWLACQRFERIDEVRQHFVDAGADRVRLCGAGPSLYAIYADESPARAVYDQLRGEGLDAYLARTLTVRPQASVPSPDGAAAEERPPPRPRQAKGGAKKGRARPKLAPPAEVELPSS